jgi:DNA-binding beta-propeller fold protein YncE
MMVTVMASIEGEGGEGGGDAGTWPLMVSVNMSGPLVVATNVYLVSSYVISIGNERMGGITAATKKENNCE